MLHGSCCLQEIAAVLHAAAGFTTAARFPHTASKHGYEWVSAHTLTYEVSYQFIIYLLEKFHHELLSSGGASDTWPPWDGFCVRVRLQQLAVDLWQDVIIQVLLQPLC
jgi:hypothetical protein